MSKLRTAFVFTAAMTIAGAACAGEQGTAADKMKRLDTDGDGRVSRTEFTAHPGKTAADFAKVDADADGYASVAELEAGKGPAAGEKKVSQSTPTTPEVTDD